MVDEPESSGRGDKTTGTSPLPALTGQNQTNDTKKSVEDTKNVLWFFKTVRGLFQFLDDNAGAVTAIATIAIAVLTWKYVTYSRGQLNVMKRQVEQIERQITDTERAQAAYLEVRHNISPISEGVWKGEFIVKNIGATIATDINGGGTTTASGNPANTVGFGPRHKGAYASQRDIDVWLSDVPSSPYGFTLAANDSRTYPIIVNLSEQMLSGERTYVEVINVGYKDAFGVEKHARDCIFWNGKLQNFGRCERSIPSQK